MRRRRKRKRKSGRRFIEFLIVGLLGLAIYFAIFGGEYTVFEIRKLEVLEAERAAELARIEAEIDSLTRVAAELESDAAAIERVARERYGMIRDGEILYRFHEDRPATPAAIDGAGKPE